MFSFIIRNYFFYHRIYTPVLKFLFSFMSSECMSISFLGSKQLILAIIVKAYNFRLNIVQITHIEHLIFILAIIDGFLAKN
jgi:hypothetical protein